MIAGLQERVMPKAFSNSVENFVIAAVILRGCSASVASQRSMLWGLCRINSVTAMTSERWLLMSWRNVASFWFSSSTCAAVKTTGSLGIRILHDVADRLGLQ